VEGVVIFKQIVDAARVGSREGLFCLGPYARRVSFSAQQNRALNLVWALHESELISNGHKVAIIGAGLAGITAAAGFIAYGCTVHLYESGNGVMVRQRDTDHRLVHPTINRWPERPLSITTELPFLEWYIGTCSEVTESISEQFNIIMKGDNELRTKAANDLRTGVNVLDVVDVATGWLKLHAFPRIQDDPTYHLVLLATGFGREETSESFPGYDYWMPDGLEKVRNSKPDTTFIVSGCGDGGLIDALRLAHHHFRKGMLAFETAAALSGSNVAKNIAEAEAQAARKELSEAQPILSAAYKEAATHLVDMSEYSQIDARLSASLGASGLVYLVDKDLKSPYSLNSAPIHKLLVAHAIRKGRVTFIHGAVERFEGRIEAGGKPLSAEAKVVIRHGAKPDFKSLLNKDEIKKLREDQQKLADDHAERQWPDTFPVPSGLPLHDPASKRFMHDRRELAKQAIRSINRKAEFSVAENGYRVVYDGAEPKGVPDKLFGVAVQREAILEVAGIAG
jgi:hypothetical protein